MTDLAQLELRIKSSGAQQAANQFNILNAAIQQTTLSYQALHLASTKIFNVNTSVKKSLFDFSNSFNKVGNSALSVNDSFNRTFEASAKLRKSLDGVNRGTAILENGFRQLMRVMFRFVALFGTVAAVRAFSRALGEFEEQMTQVRGVAIKTTESLEVQEEQFAALSAQAKVLGATTRFTATEAAKAQLLLARAGFEVRDVMEALPSVLALASAGVLSLEEAADIATNTLKQFNLAGSDMEHVSDVLVTVANATNTNIREMAEALKYAGPIAAATGHDIEEVASAVGILSNAGVKASLAGTQFRQMIASLSKQTPQAEATLNILAKRLGKTREELFSLSKENRIPDILKTMASAGADVNDFFRVFTIRAANSAIVLSKYGDTLQELEELTRDNRGETKRLSDMMANTLIGRVKTLGGALETLILQMGDDGLGKSLKDLITFSTDVIRFMTGTRQQVQLLESKFKLGLISAEEFNAKMKDLRDQNQRFTPTVKAAANAIRGLTTAAFAFVALKLSSAVLEVGVALASFGAGPVAATAILLGTIVGLLYHFKDALIEIKGTTGTVGDLVKAVWGEILERMKIVGEAMGAVFDHIRKTWRTTLADMLEALTTWFDSTTVAAKIYATDWGEVWDYLTEKVKTTINFWIGFFSGLWNWLKKFFSKERFGAILNEFWLQVKYLAKFLWLAFQFAFESIKRGVGLVGSLIVKTLSGAVETVIKFSGALGVTAEQSKALQGVLDNLNLGQDFLKGINVSTNENMDVLAAKLETAADEVGIAFMKGSEAYQKKLNDAAAGAIEMFGTEGLRTFMQELNRDWLGELNIDLTSIGKLFDHKLTEILGQPLRDKLAGAFDMSTVLDDILERWKKIGEVRQLTEQQTPSEDPRLARLAAQLAQMRKDIEAAGDNWEDFTSEGIRNLQLLENEFNQLGKQLDDLMMGLQQDFSFSFLSEEERKVKDVMDQVDKYIGQRKAIAQLEFDRGLLGPDKFGTESFQAILDEMDQFRDKAKEILDAQVLVDRAHQAAEGMAHAFGSALKAAIFQEGTAKEIGQAFVKDFLGSMIDGLLIEPFVDNLTAQFTKMLAGQDALDLAAQSTEALTQAATAGKTLETSGVETGHFIYLGAAQAAAALIEGAQTAAGIMGLGGAAGGALGGAAGATAGETSFGMSWSGKSGGTIWKGKVLAMRKGRINRGVSAGLGNGIIDQPTLASMALIGEGAHPEVVMPGQRNSNGGFAVQAQFTGPDGRSKSGTMDIGRMADGNLGVKAQQGAVTSTPSMTKIVNFNQTVVTPNADSFKRSRYQIERRARKVMR